MGTCKVKIFPAAQRDLEKAIDYLNTLSPQAAIRYYDLLVCEIAGLSKMPERCPRPKDLALAAKGYRYLIAKNYLVFYVVPETRCRSAEPCTPAGAIGHCCKDE